MKSTAEIIITSVIERIKELGSRATPEDFNSAWYYIQATLGNEAAFAFNKCFFFTADCKSFALVDQSSFASDRCIAATLTAFRDKINKYLP